MSAYKSEGSWRFRKQVTFPDGSQRRVTGTPALNTRVAAEQAEREAIERALTEARTAPKRGPVPFDAFSQEWLKTHPAAETKASTARRYEYHIRMHLAPAFGDTPLHEIDNLRLTRLVADLRAKHQQRNTTGKRKRRTDFRIVEHGEHKITFGRDIRCDYKGNTKTLSAATVKGIMITMHVILSKAVDWNKLERLPKFPEVKVPEAPWDWLEKAETDRLYAAIADPEDLALLMFAAKTGARAGELLALRWDDLDLKKGQVKFSRNLHHGEEGTIKTGKHRTVDLVPSLREALQRIRHLRSQKVFCTADGAPLTVGILKSRLQKYLRLAGLRRIRWHDLRHTFASQLVSANAPLIYVQKALGHSSIAMTMRYAHLAPSKGQDIIALLDKESA